MIVSVCMRAVLAVCVCVPVVSGFNKCFHFRAQAEEKKQKHVLPVSDVHFFYFFYFYFNGLQF